MKAAFWNPFSSNVIHGLALMHVMTSIKLQDPCHYCMFAKATWIPSNGCLLISLRNPIVEIKWSHDSYLCDGIPCISEMLSPLYKCIWYVAEIYYGCNFIPYRYSLRSDTDTSYTQVCHVICLGLLLAMIGARGFLQGNSSLMWHWPIFSAHSILEILRPWGWILLCSHISYQIMLVLMIP